jgi:hypothetical protein
MGEVVLTSKAESIEQRKDLYIFILHTMQIGGVESLAVRMANSLAKLGKQVYFLCPDGPMVSSRYHYFIRCFEDCLPSNRILK